MKTIQPFPNHDFLKSAVTAIFLMRKNYFDEALKIFQSLLLMEPPRDGIKILADIYLFMPQACKEQMSHSDLILLHNMLNKK
jgi:hypothetical protein